MNIETYEKKFREKADNVGFSEDAIIKCLNYATPLIHKNLPVIFNTANLAALVGYKKEYLKKAALFTDSYYRNFKIKKKNGTFRELKEPLPSLKEIQLWILENIFYKINVSKFAKAYIPGRTLVDNAKYHKGKKIVLNLDIKNFFSSIKRQSVESIFVECGYSSNISNLLSKLCCCNDLLPQGAPTSPYISNIILNNFDDVVSNYCEQYKYRYTRYADDLTFSGDLNVVQLIFLISSELQKIDLTLNYSKVQFLWQNQRQIVTGIVVNEKIQTTKTYRRKIRQEIYFIKKFGLNKHLIQTRNVKANYVQHLLGKINYVLFVNPNDLEMTKYKNFILQTLASNDTPQV